MDECEHSKKMIAEGLAWEAAVGGSLDRHCGDWAPHSPHDNCLGIMCDHGCNAEEF